YLRNDRHCDHTDYFTVSVYPETFRQGCVGRIHQRLIHRATGSLNKYLINMGGFTTMRKKQWLSILLVLALVGSLLAACASGDGKNNNNQNNTSQTNTNNQSSTNTGGGNEG